MAFKFRKLGEVDRVETASESASVLIEENGVIKKTPGSQFGGINTETVMQALIETDMLPAVYDNDGKILTDENGNVILRY